MARPWRRRARAGSQINPNVMREARRDRTAAASSSGSATPGPRAVSGWGCHPSSFSIRFAQIVPSDAAGPPPCRRRYGHAGSPSASPGAVDPAPGAPVVRLGVGRGGPPAASTSPVGPRSATRSRRGPAHDAKAREDRSAGRGRKARDSLDRRGQPRAPDRSNGTAIAPERRRSGPQPTRWRCRSVLPSDEEGPAGASRRRTTSASRAHPGRGTIASPGGPFDPHPPGCRAEALEP
jgi:hypothetical protein